MNNKTEQTFKSIAWALLGVIVGLISCALIVGNTQRIFLIDRANEYLDAIPMSFPELVEQLAYEFTYDDAIYGASNCGADWNVVAGRCAEEYIDKNGNVPKALLVAELMIKGFTEDQAEFACDYVGVQ